MSPIRPDELRAIGADVRPDGLPLVGVSTDSRTVQPGELFVALKGDRFDGHDHVAAALKSGAALALVSTAWAATVTDAWVRGKLVVVADPLIGLQHLARNRRRAFSGPVIAVTGSNGKTTTKELLAAALEPTFRVLKTIGNLNNHIGLPLTLMRLSPDEHDAAVIEMGMNHEGEIADLCALAEPTAGLVTNVGRAHIEFFADGQAGIARAKGELFAYLAAHDGRAYVNLGDERVTGVSADVADRVTYALDRRADLSGTLLGLDEAGCATLRLDGRLAAGGSVELQLAVPGRHNAVNAVAAAAVALDLGVQPNAVADALAGYRPDNRRMQVVRTRAGVTILDDTYNANPDSTAAALTTLSELPAGTKLAALGDMLELGGHAAEAHREMGEAAARSGVRYLFTFGPESRAANAAAGGTVTAQHYGDKADLAAALLTVVQPGDAVLVKGSRGMRMEAVVEALVVGLGGRI